MNLVKNKVSVIVPIYNAESTIRRCVDSLINQSLEDIEIILMDDGSTDRSGPICDEYAKMDQRVVVIHKKNGGEGTARNIGINAAKGEYIGFVDSDDYLDCIMFEEMYGIAKKENVDIVHCGCIYEDGETIEKLNTRFDKDRILSHSEMTIFIQSFKNDLEEFWFAGRNIYRTEYLKEYAFLFDETVKYGADTNFNLKAFFHAKSFYSMDKYFYHYVKNLNGIICAKYKESYLEHLSATYQRRIDICKDLNLDPAGYLFEMSRTVIEKFLIQLLVNEWESHYSGFKKQLKAIRNSKMISESFSHYKSSGRLSRTMQFIVFLMKYRMYQLIQSAFAFRYFRSHKVN